MTDKVTALQRSIRQATAALNGDSSMVTVETVKLISSKNQVISTKAGVAPAAKLTFTKA
ncbi:hypothetical protein [Levilactobacillus andaensis]|uniref:hypothetical protein n=1 Tax=Levilactobacillus andaensis TaxID=2799570 RepID=UPI001941A238|nr:hypothetical protein [Levilactobacillus andaensis]